MIYSIPKLISLDSLNLTYKEASGLACSNGTGPAGDVCTGGGTASLCGSGSVG